MDNKVEPGDLQFCLRRILRLFPETGAACLRKHPFVSIPSVVLFIVYMSFPRVFWILIHSIPFVVCVSLVIFWIFFRPREEGNDQRSEGPETTTSEVNDRSDSNNIRKVIKTPVVRVHSVRRRRPRDFSKDNDDNGNNSTQPHNVEEKTTISFDYDQMVEKNSLTITEESPRKIRQVEVNHSLVINDDDAKVPGTLPSKDKPREAYRMKTLEALKLVENARDDAATEGRDVAEDDHVIDVGDEGNKRLESLMARRRSRNLWSNVRRAALLNMDKRNHPGQIAPIIIPNYNIYLHSGNATDPSSPAPTSAPSILIPMKNPFDLPYDPQEEKPDLTGDTFQEEFMSSGGKGDPVFCRHESFTLGGFSLTGFDQKGGKTSSDGDGGFGRRNILQRYRFSKPQNDFDWDFSHTIEEESHEEREAESMSPTDSRHEDIGQIKDTIHKDDYTYDTDYVQTRQKLIQEKDILAASGSSSSSLSSSSSSSSSSSEEDEQMEKLYKMEKEATLKSLSSMTPRHVIEGMEDDDEIINGYVNSHFDNKTVPHSYSIASDMQVEFSESSSPRHGIEDVLTYNDGDIITPYDDHGSVHKKISDGGNVDRGISRVWSSENPHSPDHEISRKDKSEDIQLLCQMAMMVLSDGGRDSDIDLHPNMDSSSVSSDVFQENEEKS